MKVVIAEDDRVTRDLLQKILSRVVGQIFEASNGLEALELVEREDPDLLVTDLSMPTLDGLGLIRAVRSSKAHRLMPIICLSATRDKDEIMTLVALGISDYILKPLRPLDALERFRRVIGQSGDWRDRQGGAGTASIMVVDGDTNFRQFAVPILEQSYTVLQAASGVQAARLFRDSRVKPRTLLIGEGLPLLGEEQLVALLTTISNEAGTVVPSFWLVTDSAAGVAPSKAKHFSGVLTRSFVPEELVAELQRTAFSGVSVVTRLRRHLREDALPWLVTAARQTLGVLSGSDAAPISGEGCQVEGGVSGSVSLHGDEVSIDVMVASGREDAQRLATTILQAETTLENGGYDVFGELSNIMGGRIEAALLEQRFQLTMALPTIEQQYSQSAADSWDLSSWFSTTSGNKFFVGLRVHEQTSAKQSRLAPSQRTAVGAGCS